MKKKIPLVRNNKCFKIFFFCVKKIIKSLHSLRTSLRQWAPRLTCCYRDGEMMKVLSYIAQWKPIAKEALDRTAITIKFLCWLHVTNNYICSSTHVFNSKFSPLSLLHLSATPLCNMYYLVVAGARNQYAPYP